MLDDQIPGLDDWDLWLRIAEVFPVIAEETPTLVWRRSTPASRQGTSQAAQLVALSARQFHKWMKLPRAASASSRARRVAWRTFSENMTEHLVWEAARSLKRGYTQQALSNLLAISRLHPLTILRIVKHRVFRVARTTVPESLAWRSIGS